ncbi:hypothetical protein HMPREF9554_00153 [Treponema phagedenis F0421]|nr:hypothetical protein HMPREF9554_00153 [Treponema phagedenis F0421]
MLLKLRFCVEPLPSVAVLSSTLRVGFDVRVKTNPASFKALQIVLL